MSATTTASDRALKVSDVAGPDRLNVPVAAVYRLIATGELKAFRVGRLLRVRESAVEHFIRQQEG